MVDYYRQYGTAEGWVLKCDVHHFFASIDHDKLKVKLKALLDRRVILSIPSLRSFWTTPPVSVR